MAVCEQFEAVGGSRLLFPVIQLFHQKLEIKKNIKRYTE